MLGFFKIKKLRTIIIIYWVLLAYIIAALIYWFLLLNKQNDTLLVFKTEQVLTSKSGINEQLQKLSIEKKRKQIQYIAEGSTFLLLILAGAIFVFRAVRRQLKLSQLQHNFMMALTHELKTPIAVTKLNLETLIKRDLNTDVQQKLIRNTLQEANRLNDLCSNMLLASQLEAGGYRFTYEQHNLSELVSTTAKEYQTRFPDRFIHCQITPDIIMLCDKLLIQIAINNLIDNAIKYSHPVTDIKIELSRDSSNVLIKILDHGNGIPDNEKEKVFNKFYRLGNPSTRESKGTGLGLYLSRTIVRQNKGNLIVANNIPNGSIFKIAFPLHKQ